MPGTLGILKSFAIAMVVVVCRLMIFKRKREKGARKFPIYHKETNKVHIPILVATFKQLANSNTLIRWVRKENFIAARGEREKVAYGGYLRAIFVALHAVRIETKQDMDLTWMVKTSIGET